MGVTSGKYTRENNPQHYERTTAWRLAHPEICVKRATDWRNSHREQHNAARRARRARDPEKFKAKDKAWRARHKEEHRESSKRWAKEHPEAVSAIRAKRRTGKTKAGGSYTVAEWVALKEKFGNRCLCCGVLESAEERLAADHVIPVSKGGTSFIENMQPLCRVCNSSKHTDSTDYRDAPATSSRVISI